MNINYKITYMCYYQKFHILNYLTFQFKINYFNKSKILNVNYKKKYTFKLNILCYMYTYYN